MSVVSLLFLAFLLYFLLGGLGKLEKLSVNNIIENEVVVVDNVSHVKPTDKNKVKIGKIVDFSKTISNNGCWNTTIKFEDGDILNLIVGKDDIIQSLWKIEGDKEYKIYFQKGEIGNDMYVNLFVPIESN